MKKFRAILELTRIEHGIMVAIAILTGLVSTCGIYAFSTKLEVLILGTIIGLTIEMGIFGFNDYFNVEEDKINAPNRPIVRGDISKREALIVSSIFLAIGLSLQLLFITKLTIDSAIILYLITFLDMLYNSKLKKYGIIGNLAVAFSTAMPFIYGATLICPLVYIPLNPLIFFLISFIATLSREIVKDIRDLEGDQKAGIVTLPQKIGIEKASKVSLALMFIAICLSPLPLFSVKNKLLYLPLILITDIILGYSILKLKKEENWSVECLDKFRKQSLIGMGIGILAFLLSSL